ncbi:hypothetical protein LPICM02_30030 [Pseudolactococcus piscium]|nr:hypothetical protein LPICM02_30030 [Lactococcus piscium]
MSQSYIGFVIFVRIRRINEEDSDIRPFSTWSCAFGSMR